MPGLSRAQSDSNTLWSIGEKNQSPRDLALGNENPGSVFTEKFPRDPVFIVGVSDPAKDWPCMQPGPDDAWAGGRTHPFQIGFGVHGAVTGTCHLILDLYAVHPDSPPQIVVLVNNHPLPVQVPAKGSGENPMTASPDKIQEQSLTFDFPAEDLQEGPNVITITTEHGSWIIYDALHLEAPTGMSSTPPSGVWLGSLTANGALSGPDDALTQTIHLPVFHFGPRETATVTTNVGTSQTVDLDNGIQDVVISVPAVKVPTAISATVNVEGKDYPAAAVQVKPMRKWIIYILPHAHHDLGYTDLQPAIEQRHMDNLDTAMRLGAETRDYPAGSRFVWNDEVLWSTDDYLRQRSAKGDDLIAAVKAGYIYPNGMYGVDLTALCRPEELVRLFRFGTKFGDQTGVPIDAAMISDVPGLSWGTIQAMNEAGLRYLSDGSNNGDRTGGMMDVWSDKAFYWLSPSGNNKVLVWCPWEGYIASGALGDLSQASSDEKLFSHLEQLDTDKYPYDIIHLRWSGYTDNATVDENLPNAVKAWNQKYSYPRLIIANTSEAFHAFEDKYGAQLPTFQGELTPWWEDGAGSSARETALTAAAADRLVQAETLYGLLQPQAMPVADFDFAWRNIFLFHEHTWGASDSVSNPDSPKVKQELAIKLKMATDATDESQKLLGSAVPGEGTAAAAKFAVFNTNNWPRTDLVTLSKDESSVGDVVRDGSGEIVPSQRLGTGELIFLARDIPPLAGRQFSLGAGTEMGGSGPLPATQQGLGNGDLTITMDPTSGGISALTTKDHPDNLIDASKANLNDYFYLPGGDLKNLKHPDNVQISVKEAGPLMASLLVQSNAPGGNSLSREVRVYRGINRVDLIDILDKKDVREVEGGHIAFPFNLPDGQVRLDSQFAVTRPDIDQIPGSCKNWFTVSRWADVSNSNFGVTLATGDAPLIEVGGITATLPRAEPPSAPWIKHVGATQTLYSYIFNNQWETNWPASQSGIITYRYSLLPHKAYDALTATRFGMERTEPLLVLAATTTTATASRLTFSSPGLIMTAFKPSDDGKALIVRLYNPSDTPVASQMNWSNPQPLSLWQSDTSEKPLKKTSNLLSVPGWSLLTLRAEF